MGTTGLYRDKGMTNREFFEREFPQTLTVTGKILADFTKGGAWYAAVKGSAQDPEQVWAMVVKIDWVPGDRSCNFYYKEMDEEMGPCYYDAPAKILDLLTPTEHEYATAWRAACREQIAKNERCAALKPGDAVYFGEGWVEEIRQAVVVDAKKSLFRGTDGRTYRCTGWQASVIIPEPGTMEVAK